MNNTINNLENGSGRLAARVTTAGNTIPVEGAIVHIKPYDLETESGGNLIYSLRTNVDGMTEYVALSAPSAEISQSPDSAGEAYSMYNMVVNKEGYYTVENIGIPVFDGVASIQPVTLIPLSDNDNSYPKPHTIVYYESGGYENLKGGAGEVKE